MSRSSPPPEAGCLVCLVQASDSMREAIYRRPPATKIAAALEIVGLICDDLVGLATTSPADGRGIDVGVLAYSTRPDGKVRLRPILPGATRERPLVPLAELAEPDASRPANGHAVAIEASASGGAPARLAVAGTAAVVARWAMEHPGAAPPVVVHCTDGESSDGPIGPAVAALTAAVPDAVIVHCVFRRGVAPSALIPIPDTPCGNLWAMSSPYPTDEAAAGTGVPAYRSLFVNKLSAARAIGDLLRRLWGRGATSETAPTAEAGTPAGEYATQAPPAAEPDVAAAPEPAVPTEPAPEPPPGPQPEPAEPAGPPRFEWRALWTPKKGNQEREWEDGFVPHAAAGVVAIADGASNAIFSKLWVDLLMRSFVAQPLPLDDLAAVEPWIRERRKEWFRDIRYPEQRWSIQSKIDSSCGAGTFLGFRLDPPPPDGDAPEAAIGWTAWVVGDVCLFHIRGGQLIASFPIASSADFNNHPMLYQSKPMGPTPTAIVARGELEPDDLIVLATDAVAQRLLAEVESDTPPDWSRFWDLDQDTWRAEIETLRDQNAIVNDDCTLVVLRRPAPAHAVPDDTASEPASEVPVEAPPEEPGELPSEAAPAEPAEAVETAPQEITEAEPPAADQGEAEAEAEASPTLGDELSDEKPPTDGDAS